jgi:hypothetical protein
LTELWRCVEFSVVGYEKTPDDFISKSNMIKTMKQTEKAIGNFLRNPYHINIAHRDNILDIFPISWKSYLVPKDIENNPGKTNKRENAIAVLKKRGLDVGFWLKELDLMSGHSYDCVEALGIGMYCSEFICRPPLLRTYRNFNRRRPLLLLGGLTSPDAVTDVVQEMHSIISNQPLCIYIPNEYHSAFENLYALDHDERFGVLMTDTASPVRLYLEHIHDVFSTDSKILLSTTLRDTSACRAAVKNLTTTMGFKQLVI